MSLSGEIKERLAGVRMAEVRVTERMRAAVVMGIIVVMMVAGIAPFIRADSQAAGVDSVAYPQGQPGKIVVTQVEKVRVPQYIKRVVPTIGEHAWPITGKFCTDLGVKLDCGAMASFRHISRILGYPIAAVSDFRTREQQSVLYRIKPGIAAPPGTSLHERGLAIDLAASSQTGLIERLLWEHGWRRFSPTGEPWHWTYQLVG